MSAATPLDLERAVRPISLEDLEPIRAELVAALVLLDEVLVVAADATSSAPLWTREAQQADIERSAAELRASLQICGAKVDTMAALLRLAHDQRRRNRELAEAYRTRKAGAR